MHSLKSYTAQCNIQIYRIRLTLIFIINHAFMNVKRFDARVPDN